MRWEITSADICGFKWRVRRLKMENGVEVQIGYEQFCKTLANVGEYINEQEAAVNTENCRLDS